METVQRAKWTRMTIGTALLLAAFIAGFMLRGAGPPAETTESEISQWTCSMHPQIKLPKAGKCPICFMDLIPVDSGDDDGGGVRELSVSENAAKLMEIETVPVQRRFVSAEVRMVGKIDYDETRVSHITAWVPGRLDRLFVDYTGIHVKKGDHMVYLYSPELLSAQEELLQAIGAAKSLERSDVSIVRETTDATVNAVREKLGLWGLAPEQITEIEERGTADNHLTIYAPAGGIVVHKNAQEGMYVETGSRIYTIADLSQVWVNLDAYESDLAGLREGMEVAFTSEAYPGETFSGTISFIHPVLDESTRTVKVRVSVPNEGGRLKPGMFVRAIVRADAVGGEETPLVIPASAPLLTGKRAIVYVEIPGKEKPTFEGREIVLGPRAGDYYLVKEGLTEGERVVTRGGFKIDAELQIRARPSMMSPGGSGQEPGVGKAQTHCPVMGGSINKDVHTDYNGMRIYFCCPGCEGTFLEKPEAYLQKMREEGIVPEQVEAGHEH